MRRTIALATAIGLTFTGVTLADTTRRAIIFRGTPEDCNGDDFGGHLPAGFHEKNCVGAGTGIGTCFKDKNANQVISYDVQADYCELDMVFLNTKEAATLKHTYRTRIREMFGR